MPEWLLDLFGRYGYAVVFFGVLLENVGLAGAGGNGAPVDRFFARHGARTVFIALVVVTVLVALALRRARRGAPS